jgi:hypothetical protein
LRTLETRRRLHAWLLLAGVSQAIAADPQWLIDARSKEGQLVDPQVVTSADKRITFSTPVALAAELKAGKDSYSVSLRLGPDAVAECEILNDNADVASLLRASAQKTFADILEPAQGKIEKRLLEHIDAGVAGATPFLSVAWLYRVKNEKGETRLGALRQVAASRAGHGIYCALNDLGYANTFEKVFRALLESLKTKDDEDAPYYSEVDVATLAGVRIGYAAVELRRDKDGDTKSLQTVSMLNATTSDTLQSRDDADVDWVTPDGALINSLQATNTNGELELNLTLKKADDQSWVVEGKFRGKNVHETIAGGLPSTFLSEAKLRRTLLAAEKPIDAEGSELDWLTADPGRFTPIKLKVLAAVDANTFRMRESSDNHTLELTVDRATGLVTQGSMQVGPTAIEFARVYVHGSL